MHDALSTAGLAIEGHALLRCAAMVTSSKRLATPNWSYRKSLDMYLDVGLMYGVHCDMDKEGAACWNTSLVLA